MPHALLLSPDDQAVNAITGVLEEMSVTCERPLDGVSAAQKLNSQSFDLVLVDCENLPAAKLIFDVCRRGKNGNHPVPIAIVDGRAGLPTAFRLGAELILTKPVAKDQARSIIRTAVSRVRKDVQTTESAPAQADSAATASAVMTTEGPIEERAMAAAAAATSSQTTSFHEPVPSFVPTSVPNEASANLAAPAFSAKTPSAVDADVDTDFVDTDEDKIDASPVSPQLTPPSALFSTSRSSESSPAPAGSASSEPRPPLKPSDDPVLAELERTELEESQLVKAKQEVSEPAKATPTQPAAKADAPVSSSRKQGRKKTSSLLAATLMLALTAGGFYAAWNYQPGFRAIAQPQIDRFLTVVGMALPPTSATSPAKRSKPVAPSTSTVPASTSPGQGSAAGSVTGSATSSAAGPATTSAAASAPVPATPSAAVAPPLSGAANASAPTVAKPEVSKASTIQKDTAATQLDTPLPGENSAIILSSKGAEKRLAQTVPPKYPVGAASGEAEGTVVLKEVVDENGKVEGVRLVEGNATLAAAAINAVKQWRYRPYIRDGKAEPFQTVVIVDFQRP